MLEIHGFQKTTLLDYPGCLASTVFFGGCNFRCPYCHNGDLVLSPFLKASGHFGRCLHHGRRTDLAAGTF